ncbi:hypothetical protein GE09DRAFT_1216418 [Coniochaeta sp. 2T2.1]|nr:hypothetical protein GE09DRAFT_1216418 [Coniochaeta sp. 2T2.1]
MAAAQIKPITGILRRNLILDLGIGCGVGFIFGSAYWYGYHMPRTNARDNFYKKLEEQRAQKTGGV